MEPYVVFTPRFFFIREVGDINESWLKGMFEKIFSDESMATFINTPETQVSYVAEF